MSFTESNTVEQMILDAVTTWGLAGASLSREVGPGYTTSLGGEFHPAHWNYLMAIQLPSLAGGRLLCERCLIRGTMMVRLREFTWIKQMRSN